MGAHSAGGRPAGGRHGRSRPAPEPEPEPEPLPTRARHRRLPVRTVARALRLTLVSVLLPGAGHVAAGRVRTGLALSASFLALVVLVVVAAVAVPRTRWLRIALEPDSLEIVIVGCGVLAMAWAAIVLRSWTLTRPTRMRASQRVLATGAVVALSLGVATPFAVGGHAAWVQRDLIKSVFPEAPDEVRALPPSRSSRSGNPPLPVELSSSVLEGKPRVNVLLLGGDGGENRTGVRTDTMVLASIDTDTGRTVLISLPRNLEGAPFPPGTEMAERFPAGFDDLLNSVYTYAEGDPSVVPGARDPGGELIKEVFGHIVGQPVDYFVLVNLAGFKDIVDAFGGVTMNVTARLPIGGRTDANGRTVTEPTAYLEPGRRKLDGYEALWYGRSRFGSDDYSRMDRQRCLLGAIAKQASPLKVLSNFGKLAGAAKRTIRTDIPQGVLPELAVLADKAKSAKVTSVTFVRSAQFAPDAPDFAYIRDRVRAALAGAERSPKSTRSAAAPLAPRTGTAAAATTPRTPPESIPAAESAASLDAVCDY